MEKNEVYLLWGEKKVFFTSQNVLCGRRRKFVCGIDLCEMNWQTMNRLQSEHPASLLPILHTASPWQFTCPADKMCLWWRDSFLSLAVHRLHSGGEICTTDSRWWVSDKLGAVKTVITLHRLPFDKMSPDLKFDFEAKGEKKVFCCLFLHITLTALAATLRYWRGFLVQSTLKKRTWN